MPFDYDPKDAENCWPVVGLDNKPIDYDAVLRNVKDTTSKVKADGSGGNPMQVLTWEVFNNDGRTQNIEEYITKGGLFKLKQLARALDKEPIFKAGKFQADDHIGCCVAVELSIEQQAGFDDKNKIGKIKAKAAGNGQQYPRDANSIRRERQPVPSLPDSGGPPEDDIPF